MPILYLDICFASSVFPMPEEPRNKKTSGCSSSIQPFSFLQHQKVGTQNKEKLVYTIQHIDNLNCSCSHRVHRVAMAATEYTQCGNGHFRAYSHHHGKIIPAWLGWGLHAHPLSLYLHHYYYHHEQSCGVRSSWEGSYTPPTSTLSIYRYVLSDLSIHSYV